MPFGGHIIRRHIDVWRFKINNTLKSCVLNISFELFSTFMHFVLLHIMALIHIRNRHINPKVLITITLEEGALIVYHSLFLFILH